VATPDVDSRAVDSRTLQPSPPGKAGELVTHAPQVMRCCWRNKAADGAAFLQIDGRRHFRTDDIAVVDDAGCGFLQDQLRRMINVSGCEVWPAEIESAVHARKILWRQRQQANLPQESSPP
jgi:fatty-acyl-CoA synthase